MFWMFLLGFAGFNFFQLSDLTSKCSFDQLHHEINKVDRKVDFMLIQLKHNELVTKMRAEGLDDFPELDEARSQFEQANSKIDGAMDSLNGELSSTCKEVDELVFWAFIALAFVTFMVSVFSLNTGFKSEEKL